MIRHKVIDKQKFGVKPERTEGCHVRGGLLSFDIRRYPAFLIRDKRGTLGAVLFNAETQLKAIKLSRKQLEEALERFERRGIPKKSLECALLGGVPERKQQLDAWRTARRELGLKSKEYDVATAFYRTLYFDVKAGEVAVYREAASADQGNPASATLSLADSTQAFRETDSSGVVANATRFFREKKTFTGLQDWVVPEHAGTKPGQPFKLWSACCSTGAETYSYAMFLHELFGRTGVRCPLQVVGTDINEKLVSEAVEGKYRVSSSEAQNYRNYFERYGSMEGDNLTIGPEIKRFIRFRPHDIKQPPRKHRFNVIICANVFQYYKDDAREHFLRNFISALESPGYIFVGTVKHDMAERLNLVPMHNYGFMRRA